MNVLLILSKKLENRADKEDLENRNIIRGGNVAPALHAVQHQLEKEKLQDTLEKKLEHRSDKEDLEERNILRQGNVAPSLQAVQQQLEKEQLFDTLGKKLENRPPEEQVKHIIHSNE